MNSFKEATNNMKNMTALYFFCVYFLISPITAFAEKTSTLTPSDAPRLVPNITDHVDFAKLRISYGKRADFDSLCSPHYRRKEWGKAMGMKKFELAYEIALDRYTKCPVDSGAHMWAYAALKELDREKQANEHKRWYKGLMNSILKTGDGKSPKTAYVTISVNEEYRLLQYIGLKAIGQSAINGPPLVDKMVTTPINGSTDEFTVYFNPYWHFVRLSKLFP